MMYKYIDPEVSGGLGENTIIDNSIHPPLIKKLNFKFDGWLGDDLIEAFPCFLVTSPLKLEIIRMKFSGLSFDEVEVSFSEIFNELQSQKDFPNFHWMKVLGVAGKDDFGISHDNRLVISDSVFELLKKFNVNNSDTEDYR